MSKYKLVPLEPTDEMVSATGLEPIRARAAYRAMLAFVPEVGQEPMKYQLHEVTRERCLPDDVALYAAPQPAQDAAGTRCARCEQGTGPKMCGEFAIHPTSYDGSPHPQDICNWCGHTRECHDLYTAPQHASCAAAVAALVDALERIGRYPRESSDELSTYGLREAARKALAAYCSGGES